MKNIELLPTNEKQEMIYKKRNILFKELVRVNDWKIKVYTISKLKQFEAKDIYMNTLNKLPQWLEQKNSFDSTNDKIGFLILHSGTEGVFSIINWWVGKNMLNSNIFMINPKEPNNFKKISGDGLIACVWELEIINHERIS